MAQDNRDFVNQFANEGGGSILCEDKRLSELASANEAVSIDVAESSPTEFVPLQDLDGNLIKISPASFQNALKNVLGKLLVANDKDGASSVRVPAISGSGANADFGSTSLSALASLLGVKGIQIISDSDGPGSGVWKKIRIADTWEATVYYGSGTCYLYIRSKDNNNQWTNWQQV